MTGPSFLEWVLLAEAAKGSIWTAIWDFFNPDASPAELARLCNSLTRNDHSRTDIITPSTESAGFRPDLKGHAYLSTHSPSNKSEGLPIHLLVAHPDAETTKNAPVILHRESDFEQSHASGNVLSHLHIGSARNQELSQHLSGAYDSRGFGLDYHPLPDFVGTGGVDERLASIIADLYHAKSTSSIRREVVYEA